MTNKTVKVAFTSTGLDKLQSAMEKVAEEKEDLGKGVTITFMLPDYDDIQVKLNEIAQKLDSLKGEGAAIPVAVTGADEVEEKLTVIGDQAKDLGTKGIDIPVVVGNEASGSLDALDASLEGTTAQIDDMAAAQERLVAGSAQLMASQDALAASVKASSDAWASQGVIASDTTVKEKVASDTQDDLAVKSDESSDTLAKLGMNAKLAAVGLAAVGVYSVYSAGKFDEMATQLVTGAGESAKNLDMVKQGMLAISAQTATSASDVASGMYLIESAGYHGAEGLDVLKAAAEGAKVGNASLSSVANALTSALNAYHLPASDATKVTNELIATVASGKMHMDDLATSIGNVLPVAAKAGISLAQVGGALATMTMQGMTTRRASMNLANAIRALESPSATASAEMKDLGLNANSISKNLGKVGLTGTLDELTEAILKNSKGGTVMASGFNSMTPAVKQMAEGILAGKVTTEQLTDAEKNMTPQQAALIAAFAKSASGATGLSQTFTGAMKTMMGGATGLQVALLLGGASATTFAKNVKSVQDAADASGKSVTGWALIQSDAAFREDQLKVSVKDMSISLGDAMLPAVESIVGPLARFSAVIASSSVYSKIFAVAIGLVVAAFVGTKAIDVFNDMTGAVKQLTGVFATSAVAADADAVATDTAAESTEAFSIALLANPIGLIIIALVALGVTIYELIVHVKAFRDFWIEAWGDIEDIAMDAFHWLESNWKLILAVMLAGATAGMSLIALVVSEHWTTIEHATSDALDTMREGIIDFGHDSEAAFNDIMHDIESVWNTLWKFSIGLEIDAFETMITGQNHFGSETSAIFTDISHTIDDVWNTTWNNTIGRLENGITDADNLLSGFVSTIANKFANAGNWLIDAGKNLIEGLYNGSLQQIGDVGSWASQIGNDIVGAVKNFFGIHSPSTVFMGIGENIMAGLLKGLISNSPASMVGKIFGGFDQALMGMLGKGFVTIGDLPAKALSTITAWASKVGATIAGVGKSVWDELFGGGTSGGATPGHMSPEAISAMWIAQGGPAYAAGNMARIAYAESGDDPSIVQAGEPFGLTGMGLYQITPTSGIVQGGQFGNLLNAVNNTRAAISLFHASGYSPWTSDPVGASLAGPGEPTGYAQGGVISEMITGMGASGRRYMFGENGPELVVPMTGLGSGSSGNQIININMGLVTDPNATAQAIHQLLRRYKTKKGGVPLGLD
jgi:hypothetical protein